MGLLDILEKLDVSIADGTFVMFLILSVIQVAPIKINPWSAIFKWFGEQMNNTINRKIDKLGDSYEKLSNDVTDLRNDFQSQRAIECRIRILRFEDELRLNRKHTKDMFDQVLEDINFYELYCQSHPNFRNNIINITIAHIKEVYREELEGGKWRF